MIEYDELTGTEQCLLDVMTEPRFSRREKYKLLQQYAAVVSLDAFQKAGELIEYVAHLKRHMRKVN